MAYLLDENGKWEREWTHHNPEPHIFEPWTTGMVLTRIGWHNRRWEAFKRAFPNYADKLFEE